MEKNTGKKTIEVSKDEFIEMMCENKEFSKSLAELMESSSELKLTYSELMDISIALTSWMVGDDCKDQMGVIGLLRALELKGRIDSVIEKELSKIGIEMN